MNHWKTSDGERVSQSIVDRRIREAKAAKLQQQLDEHGYNFCERTGRSQGVILDCSHNISVKKAKESGRTELCWDLENLEIINRELHQKKDKLNLSWTNK